jgi:ketosteroid isomerase-like protein
VSLSRSERQIRALVDDLAIAIRFKDVEGLMGHYAPDVLTFDLLPPLQHSGADAIRNRLSDWFSSFQGPIGFEMRNLNITAGDDVAFCHSLNGVSGARKDGGVIDMWWRAIAEVRRLRAGIRTHRDSSGHDLCWHHPELWSLLPERVPANVAVPAWPQFLRGCVRYRESLDRQRPDAPRIDAEFDGSSSTD